MGQYIGKQRQALFVLRMPPLGCMIIFFSKPLAVWKRLLNFAGDMKKEFGKWLMDIAKYMVTALLLATIFSDMDSPIIVYIVVILSAIVLCMGLYWVNEGYKEESSHNKKIKK